VVFLYSVNASGSKKINSQLSFVNLESATLEYPKSSV
jgi:hypothetical protein